MEILRWKTRITALWLIMAVVYSAHMALSIFEPGVIQMLTSGEMQISEFMFIFSTLFAWLIPLTLAFLSISLKDHPNRWTNIILGIVFTIVNIGHLAIEQFTQPSIHMAQPSVHQFILNLATVLIAALITWYAWKWPKQGE
jgi:hypothetical protein